jgi:hypothetical protein
MAISKDNERIIVTVSKEIKSLLQELAQQDKRSLSNYCALVLEQHAKGNSK